MRYIECKTYLSGHGGNPYRGCTHGCIYCDSRSLCYRILDFDNIEVKKNAPQVLDAELSKKRSRFVVTTGSMCDPYLPIEKEEGITRKILEVILHRGFGAGILTKSTLALRDLELIQSIHRSFRAVVCYTVTTADDALCKIVERNVSPTSERFRALKAFHDGGVDTGVWMTPLLPFINDTEENVREIVRACGESGVRYIISFGFGTTMRTGSREPFYAALDRDFPGVKKKYIQTYGDAYECPSPHAQELRKVFEEECAEFGILCKWREIEAFLSPKNPPSQISLFD